MHNIERSDKSKKLFTIHANKLLMNGERNAINVITPLTAFALTKENDGIRYTFYTLNEECNLEYKYIDYPKITLANLNKSLAQIDGSYGINLMDKVILGNNPFSNFTNLPYNYYEIFSIIRLINSYSLGVGMVDKDRNTLETRSYINFLPACDNSEMVLDIDPINHLLYINFKFSMMGVNVATRTSIEVNYNDISFFPVLFRIFKHLCEEYLNIINKPEES